MKNNVYIILPLLLLLSFNIDAQKYKNYSFHQKMKYALNFESTLKTDKKTGQYEPIFVSNGGAKTINVLNKGKAKKEKQFILDLKIDSIMKSINAGTDELDDELGEFTDSELTKKRNQLDNQVSSIYNEIKKIAESDQDDLEKQQEKLKLLTKINDLKHDVDNLKKLSKNVRTLQADLSFKTGKFDLTSGGAYLIESIEKDIYKEIDGWGDYLKDHNMDVFKEKEYFVKILVNGYTDEQGYSAAKTSNERQIMNKDLSTKRAYSVRTEINETFNLKYNGLNISLSIEYIGKGEELPPNVSIGPEDDPNRRICTVSTLVGPKSLIKLR